MEALGQFLPILQITKQLVIYNDRVYQLKDIVSLAPIGSYKMWPIHTVKKIN